MNFHQVRPVGGGGMNIHQVLQAGGGVNIHLVQMAGGEKNFHRIKSPLDWHLVVVQLVEEGL